jgi:aminoglycoside/choline kinase family phosphotransferase
MFDDRNLREQICAFAADSGFPGVAPDNLALLALGGSDRRFYRVSVGSTSCVAMISPPPGDEQKTWLDINRFLHSCSIAVPDVFAQDSLNHMMLVEDVGDMSLYHALRSATDRQAVLALYKRSLMFLAEMQVRATPRMQSCACLRTRRFDYASFRAETDYFIRSFLKEYCRMEAPAGLEEEFHRLALTLSTEPLMFMHRDFQSQNMHLTGNQIKVIDFQTATAGPPQYDLVSFLKDAYFVLRDTERSSLLQNYFDARSGLGSPVEDPVAFTHTFHLCGLQRNMQALAAFSFLGTHKKKTHFYAHIPAALNYLDDALETITEYPCLHATIAAIKFHLPGFSAQPPNQY